LAIIAVVIVCFAKETFGLELSEEIEEDKKEIIEISHLLEKSYIS